MSQVLSSGLSGLLAFQRALDTTAHNIANANTEGYTRQRVEFATLPASPFSNGWIGKGVEVTTVRRMVDDFLVGQTRTSTSSMERLAAFAAQAERVSKLFVDGDNGLSGALQKFQNAVQGVATEPSSVAARQVLLGAADGLVERLDHVDSQLRALDAESATQVRVEASEINAIASGIALVSVWGGLIVATYQPWPPSFVITTIACVAWIALPQLMKLRGPVAAPDVVTHIASS